MMLRPLVCSEPVPVPDRPVLNPAAVLEQGADGWALLVNPDTAGSMALNRTGVLVWQLIDGKRTVEGIIDAVRVHCPDAPDSMTDDIQTLLVRLTEEGFVGKEIPLRSLKNE